MQNSTQKNSVKYICENIFKLEKKFNLLNLEIQNIKIWHVIRVPIFFKISQEIKSMEIPHTIKNSFIERLSALPSFFISSTIFNPFFHRSQKKILIFDHSRKTIIDNEYIDIHTHYLIKKLYSEKESFEIFEEPHLNKHYTKSQKNRNHLDFILILSNLYAIFKKFKFTEDEIKIIKLLNNEIEKIFHIKIDLKKIFSYEIKKFKGLYFLYSKLLKFKKPKKIFVLVGYGHIPLIKAAKDLNIQSIEIQHGTMSEYHLGYHFPESDKDTLDYFPDKLFIWDDFWKEMCNFPISEKNIITTGFEYLNREKKHYSNTKKNLNQIIVISQGTIGPQLSDFILQKIEELKKFQIIYKLHPGEYDRYQEYKSLIALSHYKNVKIIDNNQIPLFQLLSESNFLIGVYSTVIFESLHFDCEVILADLPGVEHMKNLINSGKAKLIHKHDKIKNFLNSQL